jgi:hypothetical protein
MEKQVGFTGAKAALDPQVAQPVVDITVEGDETEILRFDKLIPGIINSSDVENMERRVTVTKAALDPQSGRLVVDYKVDGGEVQRLDFAVLITVIEKETARYVSNTKGMFEGILWEPRPTHLPADIPQSGLYELQAAFLLMCIALLDLARRVELYFHEHRVRLCPELDEATGRIVDGVWALANL